MNKYELIDATVKYIMSSDEPLRDLQIVAEHMQDTGRLNEFFQAFWLEVRRQAAEV